MGLVVASEGAGILRDLGDSCLRRLLFSKLSGKMAAAENKGRLSCIAGARTERRQKNIFRLKKYRMTAWL